MDWEEKILALSENVKVNNERLEANNKLLAAFVETNIGRTESYKDLKTLIENHILYCPANTDKIKTICNTEIDNSNEKIRKNWQHTSIVVGIIVGVVGTLITIWGFVF